MKRVIIVLIILIIIITICINQKEKFSDIFYPIYKSDKCCIINKKLDENGFYYNYTISDMCDTRFDNTSRCIKDKELIDSKQFDLNECNKKNNIFGSCRKIGFECIDFITEKDCNKYNMLWSQRTCNDNLIKPIIYPDYKISQI